MKGKILELRSLLRKIECLAMELSDEAKAESHKIEMKLLAMQSNGTSFRESIPTFKKMNYYDRVSSASKRLASSAEFDRITNQLFTGIIKEKI